jgi:acetoacetate decarboxylase
MPVYPSITKPPPPYFFKGHTLTIFYESDPKVLREMLPEPLEPAPSNLVTIDAQYLPWSFPCGPCSEGGVYIAARYKDIIADYCPFMFMDSDVGVYGGREIYGYPKEIGNISLTFGGQALEYPMPHGFPLSSPHSEPGGREIMSGVVSRCGIDLYKINVALVEKGKPDDREIVPGVPRVPAKHIVLKMIPNVDGKPLIRQLNLVPLEQGNVLEEWKGPATISFGESPSDPIYKLKPVKVLGGVYQNVEIWLGTGKILYDYLKAPGSQAVR